MSELVVKSPLKDDIPINLKSFKKVFSKFVQENEIGVHRQLRRSMTSPRSFSNPPSLTSSPRRLPSSPRSSIIDKHIGGSMEQAIRLDAYESPVLSPRDRLKLKRMGKSEKDLKQYLSLISPRLDRRNSLKKDAVEFSRNLEEQINNLRSITSDKSKKISKSTPNTIKRNSF